jgi:phosphoribosylanthranilate isomerase
MPSGPGPIPESQIAEIASAVPPEATSILLTSLREPDEIIAQHRRCRTDAIQLVDRLKGGAQGYALLRACLPGVKLMQVVHVTGEEAVEEAIEAAANADAILLDSGNPSLPVRELGGTGRTHDWSISRRIRESVSVPVYLAGGLDPENVKAAVRTVRPFAVDVCRGLRIDGRLDENLLRKFVEQL